MGSLCHTNNKARLRTVKVGQRNGLSARILEGLAEGEAGITHPVPKSSIEICTPIFFRTFNISLQACIFFMSMLSVNSSSRYFGSSSQSESALLMVLMMSFFVNCRADRLTAIRIGGSPVFCHSLF